MREKTERKREVQAAATAACRVQLCVCPMRIALHLYRSSYCGAAATASHHRAHSLASMSTSATAAASAAGTRWIESSRYAEKRAQLQAALSQQKAGCLHVITDFDLTLTAPGSLQCHHMFGQSAMLSEESKGIMESYLRGVLPPGHQPMLSHGE